MNNADKSDEFKLEKTETRELTLAELENVSGGGKNASNGKGNSVSTFLKFEFKSVFVS